VQQNFNFSIGLTIQPSNRHGPTWEIRFRSDAVEVQFDSFGDLRRGQERSRK